MAGLLDRPLPVSESGVRLVGRGTSRCLEVPNVQGVTTDDRGHKGIKRA